MNAPDRTAETAAVVEQHRDLFGTDDSRRPILWFVCQALNAIDDNNWGIIVKSDQNGFIPSDVICWAPTREHFDILKGAPDGPSWQPRGVLQNPAWHWASADLVKPANAPPALPPAVDPPSSLEPKKPALDSDGFTEHDYVLLLLGAGDAIVKTIDELSSSLHTNTLRFADRDDGAISELTAAVSSLTAVIARVLAEGVRLRAR